MATDDELHQWIDQLDEEKLRHVIHYLVLLNSEAVHNAMQYTMKQEEQQQEDAQEEVPDSTNQRRAMEEVEQEDDRPFATGTSSSSDNSLGKVILTPKSSILSKSNSTMLIVLCSMKPSTKQEAIDQDEAMILCKQKGILPYIVLAESKPEKAKQFMSISHLQNVFPQFFKSDLTSSQVEFLGNFDAIQNQPDLLLVSTPTTPRKLFQEGENDKNTFKVTPEDSSTMDALPSSSSSLTPSSSSSQLRHSLKTALRESLEPSKNTAVTDETDSQDKPFRMSLEPPEGGEDLALQMRASKEEPPAKSPPKTTAKVKRTRDHVLQEITAPPTPNLFVNKPPMEKPEPTPRQTYGTSSSSDPLEPPNPKILDYENASESIASTSPKAKGMIDQQASSLTNDMETQPQLIDESQPHEQQQSPDDQILSLLQGIGACYLVLEDDALNIYYSEHPMDNSVGVWTSPDILDFKNAQGLGESEFIGNCANGCDQSPTNYFKGWSQFVKAAKSMNGTIIILHKIGLPMDFYVYCNNNGNPYCELVPGIQFDTAHLDAVACLPRDSGFSMHLQGRKWTKAAKKLGAVATFNSLVHNTGASVSSTSSHQQVQSQTIIRQEELPPPVVASLSNEEASRLDRIPSTLTDLTTEEEEHHHHQEQHQVQHQQQQQILGVYPSAIAAPNPSGGACYLVYEPDSSGRLVEHYSRHPIEGAIGRWVPGSGKKIAGFKFKQNVGRNVLIGNCSAGVQGRKNYCSGWNQFVRSAKVYNGDVMLWDPTTTKGMPVDVWLYHNDTRPSHQSQKLEIGVEANVKSILAVCTIPKNTRFYEGMSVDLLKWLADGDTSGASSKFE